jgi:hypothetical protein
MRRVWAVVLACVLALAAAACGSVEGRYYREGIGTDLWWSGLPEATRLQEFYIGYICQQAGLPVIVEGDYVLCAAGFSPPDWSLFFQAGMNDIDRRCDAYLTWLDDKRRGREPVLKQLASTGAAIAAILRAAEAGPTPIAIVGIAFGLAADTFTNVTSRLLLEVNHSTVQSVVLGYQADFREKHVNDRIDNQPAAIYLLRSYLRLCMPYSIEMSINNTVTVYHRDPEALSAPPLLLRTAVPRGPIVHDIVPLRPAPPVTPQSRPDSSTGPICGVNPPDTEARRLLEFLCPNNVIVGANRKALQELLDRIRPSTDVEVVLNLPQDQKLRRSLLNLLDKEITAGRIKKKTRQDSEAPTGPICGFEPPDLEARALIEFICPTGVIVNANRDALQRLFATIQASKDVETIFTLPQDQALRQRLLKLLRDEMAAGRITKRTPQ